MPFELVTENDMKVDCNSRADKGENGGENNNARVTSGLFIHGAWPKRCHDSPQIKFLMVGSSLLFQ